jgi:mannose-6-phosphate isomerase-like protein (cupin superfamily)
MAKYTVVKTDDVANYSEIGEMRMMRNALDSKQIALTYRRIPAGYKPAHGHSHSKIDEVVFVFAGTLQIKLDDEIIEVGPKTAVKISPETKRGYHNAGTENVEMIVASPQVAFVGDNGGIPDKNWWQG